MDTFKRYQVVEGLHCGCLFAGFVSASSGGDLQGILGQYLIYVPTFTYGYKLWVLTKTMTSHIKQ